jgi:hypothetical protein
MGVSRSASVVAAYLLYKNKCSSVEEALQFIANARPFIQPNPGFIKGLLQFEKEIHATRGPVVAKNSAGTSSEVAGGISKPVPRQVASSSIEILEPTLLKPDAIPLQKSELRSAKQFACTKLTQNAAPAELGRKLWTVRFVDMLRNFISKVISFFYLAFSTSKYDK